MNGKQTLYVLAAQAAVATVTIIGATVLGWHGSLDSATIAAIYGAVIGLVGGSAGTLGVHSITTAAQTVPIPAGSSVNVRTVSPVEAPAEEHV